MGQTDDVMGLGGLSSAEPARASTRVRGKLWHSTLLENGPSALERAQSHLRMAGR
jgi:hypothetical protein